MRGLGIRSSQISKIFISVLLLISITSCTSIDRREVVTKKNLLAITNKANINILLNKKVVRTTSANDLQDNAINLATDSKHLFTIDLPTTVVAIDRNAATIWRQTIGGVGSAITAGPIYYQGKLIVITSDPKVICLSAKDGKVLWTTELSSNSLALPALTVNEVFVRTIDGGLTALKLSDGKQIWRVSTLLPDLTLLKGSQPKIYNNYVVAGFANGKLSAIDKLSGEVLWSLDLSDPKGKIDVDRVADISAAPVISGGKVYAISSQGLLGSANLINGEMIWKQALSSYNDILLFNGRIYIVGTEGKIFAVDQASGRILWVEDQLEGRNLTNPVAFKNYVVLGDNDGYLHFIDQVRGTIENRILLKRGSITISPIIIEQDQLQVLTEQGYLISLSIKEQRCYQ